MGYKCVDWIQLTRDRDHWQGDDDRDDDSGFSTLVCNEVGGEMRPKAGRA